MGNAWLQQASVISVTHAFYQVFVKNLMADNVNNAYFA